VTSAAFTAGAARSVQRGQLPAAVGAAGAAVVVLARGTGGRVGPDVGRAAAERVVLGAVDP